MLGGFSSRKRGGFCGVGLVGPKYAQPRAAGHWARLLSAAELWLKLEMTQTRARALQ